MLKSKKGIIKPKLDSSNLGLEIRRIDTIFTKAGLKEISVPSLLNSSDLVDLYGEDLKLRAYTTSDPVAPVAAVASAPRFCPAKSGT